MQSLQCARATAALLVVYFHTVLQITHAGAAGMGELPVAPMLPLFGKSGVDVFFVLSGLLIWCSTQETRPTLMLFYRKRLLRIAPLYWLLTLVVAVVALLAPEVLRSTRFDPAHLAASLLFVPWPNPASHGSLQDLMTPPIVPGWTLNFEIFFYLVFGPCLLAPRRWRLPATLLGFGLVITAIWTWGDTSVTLGFYDPGLILEFVIGLCLGFALERGLAAPVASAWLLLGAAAELLVLLDWGELGWHRLYTSGLPAAVLLFSLATLEAQGRWPRLPWLVALGDATYSLYLTHVFVLAGLRMVLGRLGAVLDSAPSQIAFASLAMTLCVVVGLASYRFLEKPLGRALRNAGLTRKPDTAVVALAGRSAGA